MARGRAVHTRGSSCLLDRRLHLHSLGRAETEDDWRQLSQVLDTAEFSNGAPRLPRTLKLKLRTHTHLTLSSMYYDWMCQVIPSAC